jgi:large subunit ribosomal protein L22
MAEKSTIATLKGLRLAPRKVSLVASLVRGRTVADALVILEHTPKRAAKPLAKLIASAKANALNNHGMQEKDLLITTLSVTAGERLKRYRPAAHGRALPFVRASSNVRLVVSGTEKPKKKPAEKPATTKKEAN